VPPERLNDVIRRLAGRLGSLGAHDLVVRLHMLTVDRVLEVVNATTNRASDLREPLRSEHQQRDHENEKKMRGLKNVTDHDEETTRCVIVLPHLPPAASI
jgi:hypothetical protein